MYSSADGRERELWQAYQQTLFRVFDGDRTVTFRIGEQAPALDQLLERHHGSRWAHVTAWNPASVPLSTEQNEERQAALIARLEQRGYAVLDGDGVDPAGRWAPERTAFVIGISVEEARRLGREFGQIAIVAGEMPSTPRLVACLPCPQS
jgi:hypothetical protein